ncbi:MAG: helix-turn-helix domain-containing protein [bacterium]
MTEIKDTLGSLGFSDAESRVYFEALKCGPSTVLELSKLTRLSRQSVYEALEKLTGISMISSFEEKGRRVFIAEHPSKLAWLLTRREQELHELREEVSLKIKELERVMGGNRPRVHVYTGREGVRAILHDIESGATKGEILEIADLNAMRKVLKPEDLAPLRDALQRHGIVSKGLCAGEFAPNAAQPERYHLPEYYKDFGTDIMIMGDKIAMVTFEGDMCSVLIESPTLAKTMRILFEIALGAVRERELKNEEINAELLQKKQS